jgi:alkyl sulfatase BDS1-like metallo-beta-lactamase superfamily hydrolase
MQRESGWIGLYTTPIGKKTVLFRPDCLKLSARVVGGMPRARSGGNPWWATVGAALCTAVLFYLLSGVCATAQIAPKPATPFTAATNAQMYGVLDFSNRQDFDDASRGFIAGLEPPRIILNDVPALNALGFYAWDLESYQFLNNNPTAPPSANPSLWRQEQLNNTNGLFMVIQDKIYQVRSYDLATMSFIKSRTGWIVIDPLMSRETARAGLALFREYVSQAPIVAIICTHSHIDHFNGIPGILEAEGKTIASDTKGGQNKGTILFYAPQNFYQEAVSENLYLGNAMSRRAEYMYGSYLPRNEFGHIGSGLGKTTGFGSGQLYAPTYEIQQNGPVMIDKLEVQFQLTPGTEAPAEMHVFFPEYGALCPGENVCHTMHNLLTSRGAKVRDPKAWAQYIDDAIDLFGPRTQVLIGVHHWPVWGNQRCLEILENQRDMYRFFNDQVIRLINKGMNMEEIAEHFELPQNLDRQFYNRGYYGSKNHNVKAVFQRYIGWWDGNPANYFKYPEETNAHKYVEFMGGESAVIAKARQSFQQGDYRWVAEVMKHVVFANPANQEAKELQADAFEQLGYTFESGTWRNIFLSGAEELRNGNLGPTSSPNNQAALATLPPTMIFDYLSTRIMGKQAEALEVKMRFIFTDAGLPDSERNLYVVLKNGVLHCKNNKPTESTSATYTLTRPELLNMLTAPNPIDATFDAFRAQLAPQPDPNWNIVLPLGYKNSRSQ